MGKSFESTIIEDDIMTTGSKTNLNNDQRETKSAETEANKKC